MLFKKREIWNACICVAHENKTHPPTINNLIPRYIIQRIVELPLFHSIASRVGNPTLIASIALRQAWIKTFRYLKKKGIFKCSIISYQEIVRIFKFLKDPTYLYVPWSSLSSLQWVWHFGIPHGVVDLKSFQLEFGFGI